MNFTCDAYFDEAGSSYEQTFMLRAESYAAAAALIEKEILANNPTAFISEVNLQVCGENVDNGNGVEFKGEKKQLRTI
jgi:hypothetical protein